MSGNETPNPSEYERAHFTRWGPKYDYRGAHVLDAQNRLAEIASTYRCETRGVVMARLRRFCGDDAGEQALATLRILVRDGAYDLDPTERYW